MALDLSKVIGGQNETANAKPGLKGDTEWVGQVVGKLYNTSTPGMMASVYQKTTQGKGFVQAVKEVGHETHADRVDLTATAANGAATFYTGGQVDARGPINSLKNAAGGDKNYTVATNNAQRIGGMVSGNPDQGMDILKSEGASMLGGKSGGGLDIDPKGFQAMFQTRKEHGNSGPANNGPKIEMPGFKMPALP